MIMLGAYEGLRVSEIARAHSDDIVGGVLRVVGKGGKVRHVPLHPIVLAALPTHCGWMFPGQIDGHVSARWVTELISRAFPDGWTAHKLRHRFASATYLVDRDLLAVQQLLGHESVETTRIYTLIPDDALSRAVMAAGPVAA